MKPSICLNMIVRNEAHVIAETLSSVTPHIHSFVIVDTGSTDNTVDIIRRHFLQAGISGEIHHRPWRNFGANRSEALSLCRGKSDYIWVIDADDIVVGYIKLGNLSHDAYLLRYGREFRYWRKQIFANQLRWAYEGVVHEHPICLDGDHIEARLGGEYYVESRRLGARNQQPGKYQRDCDALHAALDRDPDNHRYTFYLAQSYFDAGDFQSSLQWYRKRSGLGGWAEEVYYALFRIGECLDRLEAPWPEVLAAFLASYECRPSRAEPFHALARICRARDRFQLGYHFAKAAAGFAFPDQDGLFVDKSVYDFRARDELGICAYYVGRYRESFDICSDLLADDAVPLQERERVIRNRDFAFQRCDDTFARYPDEIIRSLRTGSYHLGTQPRVTATITSCKRLALFRRTLNSFLGRCRDLEAIDRWICVDDNSSKSDRRAMRAEYPFFEFVFKDPADRGHARSMNILMDMVDTPYWLHLEDDWMFISPERYVGKSMDILAEDPDVGQVLFNRNYGESLACRDIHGGVVKTTRHGHVAYRLHQHLYGLTAEATETAATTPPAPSTNNWWPHFSLRPSMMATDTIKKVGRYNEKARHFELEFAQRYTSSGLKSAFFDYITCLHTGRRTWERRDKGKPNAYELNNVTQF